MYQSITLIWDFCKVVFQNCENLETGSLVYRCFSTYRHFNVCFILFYNFKSSWGSLVEKQFWKFPNRYVSINTYNFTFDILSKFRKQNKKSKWSCLSAESFLTVCTALFNLIHFCSWNAVTSTLDLNWSPLTRSVLGMTWYFSNLSFYNPQLCLETSASVITQC